MRGRRSSAGARSSSRRSWWHACGTSRSRMITRSCARPRSSSPSCLRTTGLCAASSTGSRSERSWAMPARSCRRRRTRRSCPCACGSFPCSPSQAHRSGHSSPRCSQRSTQASRTASVPRPSSWRPSVPLPACSNSPPATARCLLRVPSPSTAPALGGFFSSSRVPRAARPRCATPPTSASSSSTRSASSKPSTQRPCPTP
mmetsp:Transcript_39889/g.98029  ORF Transcript_39889/g.98029 Transcript_39889/m.98029 type:complete len:201 (+) Transcript_39889:153-755(+)